MCKQNINKSNLGYNQVKSIGAADGIVLSNGWYLNKKKALIVYKKYAKVNFE